jgi:hypothetical protein
LFFVNPPRLVFMTPGEGGKDRASAAAAARVTTLRSMERISSSLGGPLISRHFLLFALQASAFHQRRDLPRESRYDVS